jgi:hypothetical protein
MTTLTNVPSYQYINVDDICMNSLNSALTSDLNRVYKSGLNKHNELEIYTIDALNSMKDYRHFFKYPISREELPKYIEFIYRNNYYIDKYNHQRKLLYVIDLYCVLLILITLIHESFHYFDEFAYSFIIGVLLSIMFIYILYNIWDMFLRSEFIFNMYDFNKLGEPPLRSSTDILDTSSSECKK